MTNTVADNWPHDRNPDSPQEAELMHLNAAAIIAQEYQTRLAHSVSRARLAGASWAQIGKELSVTKQAAQQRFGDKHDCITEQCGTTRTRFV